MADTRTMLAMSLVCRSLRCCYALLELLRREQAAWCGEEYVPLSGGCKKKDPASMGGMSLKACRHRRILSLLCGTPEAGAVFESAVGVPRLEHGGAFSEGDHGDQWNDMDVPLDRLRSTRPSRHGPSSTSTEPTSHPAGPPEAQEAPSKEEDDDDDFILSGYSTDELPSDVEASQGNRKWPPNWVSGSILQVITFSSHHESPDYLEYLPAEHVGVLVEVSLCHSPMKHFSFFCFRVARV